MYDVASYVFFGYLLLVILFNFSYWLLVIYVIVGYRLLVIVVSVVS